MARQQQIKITKRGKYFAMNFVGKKIVAKDLTW